MKRSLAAVLFASLALAGCGSATEGLDFKAPAGWTALPSFIGFGHLQMWTKKASDNKQVDMLMLIRGQTTATMDLKTLPQSGMGAIKAQKTSTITICGNRRAQYLSAIGTGHGGQTQTMEMVSAPVGDQSFLAMYIRPKTDPADPAAETAIRSLCAAKT
jgi:hypothetical protein